MTGSDPVDAVSRGDGRRGPGSLPLGGAAIERLRHDYPFFRPTIIHGGTYPGHRGSVRTIGVDNLLLCRRGLDEAIVHDLTRQFFAAPAVAADPDAPWISSRRPATPIPLHEGAARYYRERELAR